MQNSRHIRCKLNFILMSVIILLLSGCSSRPSKPDDVTGYAACWPCAIYESLIAALEDFIKNLTEVSCQNAFDLLGICLLFWIIFHVGKFVVTIQEPNIRKFFFPMATIFFKAVIVAVLIASADTYTSFISENLVQPLLEFFAKVSGLVLDTDSLVKLASTPTSEVAATLDTTGFFGSAKKDFLDVVYRLYVALKMGSSLGFAIWGEEGFSAFWVGLFVIIMFWMLLLTMPLLFLDAFARMAAMIVISPFLWVAWVFPPTKKMLGKMWGVFLGSGVTMMFVCFYVSLTTYVVLTYTERYIPGILGTGRQEADPMLVKEMASFSTGSLGFLVLILSLNRLSRFIPKLANQFGGESVMSSWIKAFGGIKKLSIAAGKVALAAAVASPTILKDAVGDVKNVASSAAQGGKDE